MKISIFGLGYVGTVSAGCLASSSHEVIGVDPIQTKVDLINSGRSTIIEAKIGDIIASARAAGHLKATTDAAEAVRETDLSFVCVGTPSRANGGLELAYLKRACEEIGQALKKKREYHIVTVRSTVLPGTMETIVIPILEKLSGKKAGIEFGVCHNPEFLREGTSVRDFYSPPKTVIGELDYIGGDLVAQLYERLQAPLIRTNLKTSEMIKYVDNSWHALKIGFANEIGNMCNALDIDAKDLMDIFVQDTKLNISCAYLKPGFAFGGSCLPKDLRALTYHAKVHDVELPILTSILPSNDKQVIKGLHLITGTRQKRIGVLGFSFKEGTDDLRESPVVEVIERLIGKGYDLQLYDKNVKLASLVGANRDFILNRIPHISRLMVSSVEEVLNHAQTVVLGTRDPEFQGISSRLRDLQYLVDLAAMRVVQRPAKPCERESSVASAETGQRSCFQPEPLGIRIP